MQRVDIRLSDDVHFELVQKYDGRRLSKGVEELSRSALTSSVINTKN
jgi:hypothetical protein